MPVESAVPDSARVSPLLLAHYDRHARVLPWRVPPGAAHRADPYAVWLSEIMLQQTTVAAVIPYFEKFRTRWPTVQALAAAEDADVMGAWAGLGYYARARNLLACARVVTGELGGVFPDTEDGLRALPGVGAYTAAAIAAIAFGQRAVVVDANVERVVARLFAIAEPMPRAKGAIREAANAITPDARAGDFAQAMMDLGASICSVRAPACLACPLAGLCRAHAGGDPAAFPVRPEKKAKPHRTGVIWWIERPDGHVWLERRDDTRMLGGMRGFPGTDWDRRGGDGAGQPPVPDVWDTVSGTVAHVFTHFALSLDVRRLSVGGSCQPPGNGEWWPLARIGEAGLPTLFDKVVRLMTDATDTRKGSQDA